MKLTVLLLTAALFNVHAIGLAQNVTISGKDLTLKQVFSAIEKQTGYVVFAKEHVLVDNKTISLSVYDIPLKELLDIVFKGQPIKYSIKGETIILSRKAGKELVAEPVARPEYKPLLLEQPPVTGIVRDSTGGPLNGATVTNKRTGKSWQTNARGEFSIEAEEGDWLKISFIGFESRDLKVSSGYMVVMLRASSSPLDQVQIIAYGKTSRRLSTGNIGTVKAADIEKQNISNPILALQGRVPGIQVTQVGGVPGSGVNVNIRGVNSIQQGTVPLFVVDGVPFVSDLFATAPGFGGIHSAIRSTNQNLGVSPLSWINPADIESIDVLKDAVATSIYGSRGANGVVLITTKKGKAGPTKVDINMQKGFGNVARRAKLLNTQQYLEMRRQAFANDNVTPTAANAPDLVVWDQQASTDWQDVMVGGTSKFTNIQASASGGNANTVFRVAGGYNRETTVFPGDWADQKTSLQFNVNHTSANQKFGISLSGSYLADNNQLPTSDFAAFILMAPNAPSPLKPDGSVDWLVYSSNPFRNREERYVANANNLVSNALVTYSILPGLELRASLGYNNMLLNQRSASPISGRMPTGAPLRGSASFNTNQTQSWIVEPQIAYNVNVGGGRLSALVGSTIQKRLIEGQQVTGSGYTDDAFLATLAGAADLYKGETVYELHRYSSLLSKINYNWKDKYLVDLSARRDGSSRFGPGAQYGNFGALGLAWIFSQERFMQGFAALSFGKIRASYGTSGNEPSGNYKFLELYNFTSSPAYGGGPGAIPTNLPDAFYQWEVGKKLEFGLELGFFKDRLLLGASFIRNRSSNQLVEYPLPSMVGFYGITANLPATVQNSGVELTLSTVNMKRKDFEWTSAFNITVNRNKLIAFPNLQNSPYVGSMDIGEPLNRVRLFKAAGVSATTGLYQFYDKDGKVVDIPAPYADKTTYLDLTPRYFGGFQNTFIYKRFSLDANFTFIKQLGENYLFTNSYAPGSGNPTFNGGANQAAAVMQGINRNPAFQKFSQGYDAMDAYNLAQQSDLAYSDASFIRLTNISLSYLLDPKIAKRLRLQGLRIFTQAQNLVTITSYEGSDPESKSINSLPPLRIITAGIHLTL